MKKLIVFLVCGLFLPAAPVWGAWSKVYIVEIDRTKAGPSSQTNFPVLFQATDPSLKSVANGGLVTNSNGYDIAVYTSGALSGLLPFEIVAWDGVAGTVSGWTKLPTLHGSSDGVNSSFAVAWGNSSITTPQNAGSYAPATVWDSSYKGVWHFGGAVLNVNDSTANGESGTIVGVPTSVAGKVDGGIELLGGSGYFTVGSGSDLDWVTGSPRTSMLTVEFWMQNASAAQISLLLNKNYSGGNGYQLIADPPNRRLLWFHNGGFVNLANSIPYDALWHHYACVFDATGDHVYVDGVNTDNDTTDTSGNSASPGTMTIMQANSGDLTPFDELRISVGTARSADWIKDEYTNMNTPGNIGAPGFLVWAPYSNSFSPPTTSIRHRVIQ